VGADTSDGEARPDCGDTGWRISRFVLKAGARRRGSGKGFMVCKDGCTKKRNRGNSGEGEGEGDSWGKMMSLMIIQGGRAVVPGVTSCPAEPLIRIPAFSTIHASKEDRRMRLMMT
jgi:hypothetical protein